MRTPVPNAAPRRPGKAMDVFRIRNFRFQFGADLLVAWAIEMEVIILAWYILTATDSALLVALVGSLRFLGTLTSPFVGALADSGSRRTLLITIRALFLLLAASLAVAGFQDFLSPLLVFAVVALSGLMRPADMMLRQSLIADSVPADVLSNAMGFFRTTLDSARLFGALAGAGLMSAIGIAPAYLVVATLYLASALLTARVHETVHERPKARTSQLHDLREALTLARDDPALRYPLLVAFLINLTVLSITGGLLPLVARDTYGLGAEGLGLMVASFAGGALGGSVLTATVLRRVRPEPLLMCALLAWHALMLLFAFTESAGAGMMVLAVLGLSSNLVLVPISVTLLARVPAVFRGRIMGLRQLAVLGLPIGLMASGAFVDWLGLAITIGAYAVAGLLLSAFIWIRWRRYAHI